MYGERDEQGPGLGRHDGHQAQEECGLHIPYAAATAKPSHLHVGVPQDELRRGDLGAMWVLTGDRLTGLVSAIASESPRSFAAKPAPLQSMARVAASSSARSNRPSSSWGRKS